jgi:hypothetical protein
MSLRRTFAVFCLLTLSAIVLLLVLLRTHGHRPASSQALPTTQQVPPPSAAATSPPPLDAPRPPPAIPDETLDYTALEARPGLEVLWARGGTLLKGRKNEQRAWERELPFAVADLRRGATPQELIATSVDGLTSVRVDAETGETQKLESTGPKLQEPAVAKEAAELLAQGRAARAQALQALRGKDQATALAQTDRLRVLAQRLSELGCQADAFKIWAAEKKLRKALGVSAPKTPAQEPTEAELEF